MCIRDRLQATLITICFRAIFDIYACVISNVEINTYKSDWCLPFFTPWFIVLVVAGCALFILSVCAIVLALIVVLSLFQCLCSFDEDDI